MSVSEVGTSVSEGGTSVSEGGTPASEGETPASEGETLASEGETPTLEDGTLASESRTGPVRISVFKAVLKITRPNESIRKASSALRPNTQQFSPFGHLR